MPRLPRMVLPGVPHHITQRGNNRQDVFFTDEDRSFYLDCASQCAADAGLDILGYCLMTNHVHWLVLPRGATSIAEGLGRAHWRYSQGINRLHGRTGHLWQGRFFSCALDEEHAYRALAYIERNPVRAKMVKLAWAYGWSSARAHVGAAEPPAWLEMDRWSNWSDSAHWKIELRRGEKEKVKDLSLHTRRGRPFGSDAFVDNLETLMGHRLRPLPVGRPKKREEK